MTQDVVYTPKEFLTNVVRPLECFREGWRLVKDQYWLFVGISAVGILLGAIAPFCILMGPMMCGIYLCYLNKLRGGQATFDTLFHGFDYFIPSLVASMLAIAVTFVVLIPIMAVFMFGMLALMSLAAAAQSQSGPPLGLIFGTFSLFILYIVMIGTVSLGVGALYAFVYPLIVDKKLDGIAALTLAVRAAWKNLLGVMGVMLIGAALGFVGMLFCYVGAFLVMPVYFGALAIAYRRIFPQIAKAVPVDDIEPDPPHS